MADIPAFNPALTHDERMAVAQAWARKAAAEVVREEGFDARRVDRDKVEAEGVALILAHWLDAAVKAGKEAA